MKRRNFGGTSSKSFLFNSFKLFFAQNLIMPFCSDLSLVKKETKNKKESYKTNGGLY